MGDQDAVENLPLMDPTSLSMFSFSSWYSRTSVRDGTATYSRLTENVSCLIFAYI